jgi:hypothetical protein
MGMKRTTVFADEEDLAVLKAAAARRGMAEAELLREAIHIEAMANRTWSEPFFTRTYSPAPGRSHGDAEGALDDVWEQKADAYRQTKRPRP